MLLEYAQTVWDRVPDDYYWVELSVELLELCADHSDY